MVSFWQAALDGEIHGAVDDDRQFVALRGSHLAIQRSPDEDRPPGRWHLGLSTATAAEQEAEVARLVSLSPSVVRHSQEPEDDYVVLVDPEGNSSCICLDGA